MSGADLAGGRILMLGRYVASLTSGEGTVSGEWSRDEMSSLMKTGIANRGAVFGLMAEVVSGSQ